MKKTRLQLKQRIKNNSSGVGVVGKARIEGILETLEILSNPEAMKALGEARAGEEQILFFGFLE